MNIYFWKFKIWGDAFVFFFLVLEQDNPWMEIISFYNYHLLSISGSTSHVRTGFFFSLKGKWEEKTIEEIRCNDESCGHQDVQQEYAFRALTGALFWLMLRARPAFRSSEGICPSVPAPSSRSTRPYCCGALGLSRDSRRRGSLYTPRGEQSQKSAAYFIE